MIFKIKTFQLYKCPTTVLKVPNRKIKLHRLIIPGNPSFIFQKYLDNSCVYKKAFSMVNNIILVTSVWRNGRIIFNQ